MYSTGTGHFAGFFSTSGILRHNLAGATDTTALDTIEQAIEQMRSGPAPTVTSFTARGALLRSARERMNIISVYARSGVTAGPLNCAALPISPSTVWWKGPKPAAQHRAHAAAR